MTESQDTDVLDPSAVFPVLADSNPAWLRQFPACKLTLGPLKGVLDSHLREGTLHYVGQPRTTVQPVAGGFQTQKPASRETSRQLDGARTRHSGCFSLTWSK